MGCWAPPLQPVAVGPRQLLGKPAHQQRPGPQAVAACKKRRACTLTLQFPDVRPSRPQTPPLAARGLPFATQLSFYIQRWCNSTSATYTNAGIDDNAYQATNFAYVQLGAMIGEKAPRRMMLITMDSRGGGGGGCLRSVANIARTTCDPNAVCTGAACVCGTNYYGDGITCSRTRRAISPLSLEAGTHGRLTPAMPSFLVATVAHSGDVLEQHRPGLLFRFHDHDVRWHECDHDDLRAGPCGQCDAPVPVERPPQLARRLGRSHQQLQAYVERRPLARAPVRSWGDNATGRSGGARGTQLSHALC